jgi:hypothetical protein
MLATAKLYQALLIGSEHVKGNRVLPLIIQSFSKKLDGVRGEGER